MSRPIPQTAPPAVNNGPFHDGERQVINLAPGGNRGWAPDVTGRMQSYEINYLPIRNGATAAHQQQEHLPAQDEQLLPHEHEHDTTNSFLQSCRNTCAACKLALIEHGPDMAMTVAGVFAKPLAAQAEKCVNRAVGHMVSKALPSWLAPASAPTMPSGLVLVPTRMLMGNAGWQGGY